MSLSNKAKGILSIVSSAFGFAVMAACVRLCDDCGPSVSCFEKSFFRNVVAFLIAAVAFFQMCRKNGGVGKVICNLSRSSLLVLLLRCAFGTIGIFANFYALSRIPIADGQTLNKTAPFFTVLLAWIFLGERMRLKQAFALIVAFVGTLLVVRPGFAGADSFALAMGLLGGCCAGAAYVAVRKLGSNRVNPSLIVLAFSAFSCLVSIPLALVDFAPLTAQQLLVLFGAGAGAALGQFGITFAYRYAAPREIAVYDYSNIIFTALLGFALFGQVSTLLSVCGIIVIVFAAVIINLKAEVENPAEAQRRREF